MHYKKLGISLALGALIAAGVMVTPAAAAVTAGSWTQYPTGATEYQAEVQQPINTANTSNWNSKSKGAIPVMFKPPFQPRFAAHPAWSAAVPRCPRRRWVFLRR